MILSGNIVAEKLFLEQQQRVKALKLLNIEPTLAVVLVGNDPSSEVYVRNKEKSCARVGIKAVIYRLPVDISQAVVIELIHELNNSNAIHAILCQLPLPPQIDSDQIAYAISPAKDVDALHPINLGLLTIGKENFIPCTVAAIMELLSYYTISTAGKKAVVVGRSKIVGRPLATLLSSSKFDATVTVCHSASSTMADEVASADLVFAAVGKSHLIKRQWLKNGAVAIDVGINRIADESERGYHLTGDIEKPLPSQNVSYSPVPGGVGPLTVAMLVNNTLDAAERLSRS